jgi:tetratricopeptide (TPR) repeat protein
MSGSVKKMFEERISVFHKCRNQSSLRIPQGGKQNRTADSPKPRVELKLHPYIFFIFSLIAACSLFSFTGPAWAQLGMDSPQVDTIIFRALELIYADSTLQAVEQLKKLIDLFPEDPIGYFYISAALQTMMDDFRNYSYKDEFNKYMELAIKKGEAKKKNGTLTAHDYLYLGGAVGFRGINKALTGNWPGAFVDGLKGRGYLDDALKVDPELYDVYYGLGSYHFWKSLKSKIFWWLPFVRDNRQKGIDMIKQAIEKGKYAQQDAKLALVRIWVENKEYDKAFAQINMLMSVYPNKPFLLWLLAQAQRENRMYDGAISSYQALLEGLTSSPYYHPAGEVECRYFLAQTYYEKGDFENASAQIDSVLKFENKGKENKSIKDFVNKTKDLQKKIKKEAKTG